MPRDRTAPPDRPLLVMPGRRLDAVLGAAVAVALPGGVVAAILWPGGAPPPPPPSPIQAAVLPSPPALPVPPAPVLAPPLPDVAAPQPALPEIRTRAALQKALRVEPPPTAVAFAQPPAPAAPPAPSAPPPVAPPSQAVQDSFESQVLGAIQAAADERMAALPAVARMMQLSGRARVTIGLRDGALLDARIEQSAGSAALDAAAMAAVRAARYPRPPPELAGRTLGYALWVKLAVR